MSDGQQIFVAAARSRKTGKPYLIVQVPGLLRTQIVDIIEPRRRLVPRYPGRWPELTATP